METMMTRSPLTAITPNILYRCYAQCLRLSKCEVSSQNFFRACKNCLFWLFL